MLWILRHPIAIAVLPFSVTVLIPIWLAHRTGMTLVVGSSATRIALQACGLGSPPLLHGIHLDCSSFEAPTATCEIR
jgi:hypothetical protein